MKEAGPVDITDKTLQRLEELIRLGRGSARYNLGDFHRCLTSARNLMLNFVGVDTPHYEDFQRVCNKMHLDYLNVEQEKEHIEQVVGILEAVRDDIATGFMFKRDLLISAENFGDILEQAQHLLSNGYKDAAAVLTGAVLESSLRKLCDKRGLVHDPKDTIEPLNQTLAKGGAYKKMTQKQITTWTDLRNNAAHGHFDKYTEAEVQQMLQWVGSFLEQQLR